jgi:hypothetical protein
MSHVVIIGGTVFEKIKQTIKWLRDNDIAFTTLRDTWRILRNWHGTVESKNISEVHKLSETLHYSVNIPAHEPRAVSDVFRATRKQLVDIQCQGCIICGSKDNLEVHHWFLEWSLTDAADWSKVKKLHPSFPNWDKVDPNDSSTFKNFTDSVYNCRVLCMIHHRAVGQGIHCLPYPLWSFFGIKKDDFDFINFDTKDIEYIDDLE